MLGTCSSSQTVAILGPSPSFPAQWRAGQECVWRQLLKLVFQLGLRRFRQLVLHLESRFDARPPNEERTVLCRDGVSRKPNHNDEGEGHTNEELIFTGGVAKIVEDPRK